MSLPFLQPKKLAGMIIARKKPDGAVEDLHEEGEMHPGLMAAAEDLISAVHRKDAKAVAEALKMGIEMSTLMPNEDEGK